MKTQRQFVIAAFAIFGSVASCVADNPAPPKPPKMQIQSHWSPTTRVATIKLKNFSDADVWIDMVSLDNSDWVNVNQSVAAAGTLSITIQKTNEPVVVWVKTIGHGTIKIDLDQRK